ncbi:MAG: hypothetical protein R3E88_16680 [Myxococcota bacterium]
MNPLATPWSSVAVAALLALALAAPRAERVLPQAARALRAAAAPLAVAVLAVLAIAALAREELEVRRYLVESVGASSACFAMLWLAALRLERGCERAERALARAPIALFALLAFAAALAAQQLVLDDIPHVSDETAYVFQAKALAQGRLGFPVPDHFEFFRFVHTNVERGVWHGIMNPGWPALLALGMRIGAGPLVDPLLAALTVWWLATALERAGAGALAARLAAAGLAIAPMHWLLGATAMSHTANMALFALLVRAWAEQWRLQRAHERAGASARPDGPDGAERGEWRALGWACIGGIALGANAAVRPLDAAAAALPFGVWQLAGVARAALATRAHTRPSARAALAPRLAALAATGAFAALGVGALLAYNAALTGDPLVLPQELHFAKEFPGQRFGFGFGPDMGTKIHGPRFPGYFPSDAPRVTSLRLAHFLADVWGAPLVLAAALAWAFWRPRADAWRAAFAAATAIVVAVYVAHFYHGIAYGARHYAIALPAIVGAIALRAAHALEARGPNAHALRAAIAALVAHVLLAAAPATVVAYGGAYRQASGALRELVREQHLTHALVFVAEEGWGWKSAFPLNDYPLERNDVLFARDLGARNAELEAAFPDRPVFHAAVRRDGRAVLRERPPVE